MNKKVKMNLTKYCYDSKTTSEWLKHISVSHLMETPLHAEEYNDVLIVPDENKFQAFSGGVFDANGLPIKQSFQRKGLQTAQQLYLSLNLTEAEQIGEEVVYLGQYRNQWGSFLVDSVSRLWFALEHPERYKYVFLATQTVLGGIHPNVWKFLNALGMRQEQIYYITKPTRFRKVIIPEMSFVPEGTIAVSEGEMIPRYHRAYLDTIYQVVDSIGTADIETHEKVYFSRNKFSAKSKTDFGENFITELMEANGFYIVYPEEHTLEEQIYYVNNCKVFASIGGSCAHNIIFSKTKPKMILFNRMNGYQWHQWMLDEMADVEPITYVDMYCEPYKPIFQTTISGPYLYLVNQNVRRFAQDLGFTIPSNSTNMGAKFITLCRYTAQCIHTAISKLCHSILGH